MTSTARSVLYPMVEVGALRKSETAAKFFKTGWECLEFGIQATRKALLW